MQIDINIDWVNAFTYAPHDPTVVGSPNVCVKPRDNMTHDGSQYLQQRPSAEVSRNASRTVVEAREVACVTLVVPRVKINRAGGPTLRLDVDGNASQRAEVRDQVVIAGAPKFAAPDVEHGVRQLHVPNVGVHEGAPHAPAGRELVQGVLCTANAEYSFVLRFRLS